MLCVVNPPFELTFGAIIVAIPAPIPNMVFPNRNILVISFIVILFTLHLTLRFTNFYLSNIIENFIFLFVVHENIQISFIKTTRFCHKTSPHGFVSFVHKNFEDIWSSLCWSLDICNMTCVVHMYTHPRFIIREIFLLGKIHNSFALVTTHHDLEISIVLCTCHVFGQIPWHPMFSWKSLLVRT